MKRALPVSGGIDSSMHYDRYRGDIAAFRRMLAAYGYGAADVRIHVAGGGRFDFDGDGSAERYRAASQRRVLAGLRWLAQPNEDDLSLLVVSNHGDPAGFCLWGNGSFISPAQIEALLRASPARKVLVFGQCFAGVFGKMTVSRSVICCACGDTESSFECASFGGRPVEYDEFLYHFVAALRGQYPDGAQFGTTLPTQATVNILEAFEFAARNDRQPETPVMFDRDRLAGALRLSG